MIGASLFLGGSAKADIDYEGVKYLGGGEKIDLNNANVRAYLKVKGMYPTLAGKVVSSGPFKSVADVYNIPGLSGAEKDILKSNEGRFVALDSRPEYSIDKINNGLYR
jgi:photosystem II PsbU protein